MNDPNQPPSSRDPRPPGPTSSNDDVAKGCLTGMGIVGVSLLVMALVGGVIVMIGIGLIIDTCGGH